MSASAAFAAAAGRRIRREAGLVHLIGVGDVPGVPAAKLRTGDELMWNYGETTIIAGIRPASPMFVTVTELGCGGRTSTRRLRNDRLVVRTGWNSLSP